MSDLDPAETAEWLQALDSVLRFEGMERAEFLLGQLSAHAATAGLDTGARTTPCISTIPASVQLPDPGDVLTFTAGVGENSAAVRTDERRTGHRSARHGTHRVDRYLKRR